jgi:hypothetical protein
MAAAAASLLALVALTACDDESPKNESSGCVSFTFAGEKVGIDLPDGLTKIGEEPETSSQPTIVNRLARYENADDSARTEAIGVYAADPTAVDEEVAVETAIANSMPRFGEIETGDVPLTPTQVGPLEAQEGTVSEGDVTYRALTYVQGSARFAVLLWTRGEKTLDESIIKTDGC